MTDIVLFQGEANPADIRLRATAFVAASFVAAGAAAVAFAGQAQVNAAFTAAGAASAAFVGASTVAAHADGAAPARIRIRVRRPEAPQVPLAARIDDEELTVV